MAWLEFSLHLKQRPFASRACRSASHGRDWVGNGASGFVVKGARELAGAAECERGRSRLPGGRENDPTALGLADEDQEGTFRPLGVLVLASNSKARLIAL